MSRGVGEFGVVQDIIPDSLALLVALLTQLGDIWFVSLLLIALFVRFDRDRIATVAGLAIGAIALVFALKHLFALPRPNEPLIALEALPSLVQPIYAATGYSGGYGFPSGHAALTTVVYLSLAETLSVRAKQRQYIGAVTVITLVSLSRIALGLHYLVDVLAGIALGIAFLLLARHLLDRYRSANRRTVSLGLGAFLAALSVLASGGHSEPLVLFVGAVMIFSLSWFFDSSRTTPA
jgi:membrane-associated phospholipid phosphatase